MYLAMLSVTEGLTGMKCFVSLHSEGFRRVFLYNSLLNLTCLVMNKLPGKYYENILVTVSQNMYFPFLKQTRVFFLLTQMFHTQMFHETDQSTIYNTQNRLELNFYRMTPPTAVAKFTTLKIRRVF